MRNAMKVVQRSWALRSKAAPPNCASMCLTWVSGKDAKHRLYFLCMLAHFCASQRLQGAWRSTLNGRPDKSSTPIPESILSCKTALLRFTQAQLCSKFLLISWPRIQSLRRSLTFFKVLLTTQQLQRACASLTANQRWGYVMILICQQW